MSKVGWLFITPNLLLSGLAIGCNFYQWAIFFGIFGLFMAFFFRDPKRDIPKNEKYILSPADGRVVFQGESHDPISRKKVKRISIFMSLWDVHVNRAPMAGRVKEIRYKKGRFLPAFKERASSENEANLILFEKEGFSYILVQIAGILARRIICYLKLGDEVSPGQRIGLICFGSRVDLYLPPNIRLEPLLGKRVKAGETIIGYLQ